MPGMDVIREAIELLRKHNLVANTMAFCFFWFVLSILHVPTVKGVEAICRPLTISCNIIDPQNASYVFLEINDTYVQGKDLRKNNTDCTNGDFYEYCKQQMNGSYQNSTLMHFVIEPPWNWLNKSNYKCLIRFISQARQNIHPQPKKIDLPQCQGDNFTRTLKSIPTEPVTNNTMTRKPNPEDCANKDIIIVATVLGLVILVLVIVIIYLVIRLRRCRRYHVQDNGNNRQVVNEEEIPMKNNNEDSPNNLA